MRNAVVRAEGEDGWWARPATQFFDDRSDSNIEALSNLAQPLASARAAVVHPARDDIPNWDKLTAQEQGVLAELEQLSRRHPGCVPLRRSPGIRWDRVVDLVEGQPVDAALGAQLARRFGQDARRLADAAGVVVIIRTMRTRTLLYAPPPFEGGMGAVAVPVDTPEPIVFAMLAVAGGFHLDGTLAPAVYADGDYHASPRFHAAHQFSRGFMAYRQTQDTSPVPFRGSRAGNDHG